MEPSEQSVELRNDGLSIHHRMELEKEFVAMEKKIAELKEAATQAFDLRAPSTSLGMTEQIGGS